MNIPLKEYWDLLATHIRPQIGRFILLTVLLFSSIALRLANPQVMRNFIDSATSLEEEIDLLPIALLFIGIALLQQIISVAAAYAGENVAWTATNALRAELAQHCLKLDMNFHNETSPGELIERIDGDVAELSNFFSQFVIRLVGNAIMLFGILIVMFFEDWRLGISFSVFTLLTILALNQVREIAIPHSKAVREASAELFGYLEERLAGTEDIRASGAVDYVLRGLYMRMHTMMGHWRKRSRRMILIGLTGTMMLAGGMTMAMYFGYTFYKADEITLGTAFLIMTYMVLLRRPVRELTQQAENMQNIGAATERLIELRGFKSKLVDGEGYQIPDGPLELEFKDVDFSYIEEEQVLKGLSLSLEKGRVLGLLGRTGSGKTTMARLIFRLWDLVGGEIRLNGVNINEPTLKQLRERVAIVTQDVQLFQASVRDNLTFFDRSISDQEIMKVVNELGLGDWLDSLPDGLDTKLKSGGSSLSAGEGQLLAFTRVFLRDPGVVILDEASSRLDPATEQLIERAVDKLLKNRTAIIIAHRLGTIERADDILILGDGKLIEHGERLALAGDKNSHFYQLLQTGLEEVLV